MSKRNYPVLPPYPPDGEGMPRYGLQWNGPTNPLSVPMDDGYWTPWHLANAEVERLQARVAEQSEVLTDLAVKLKQNFYLDKPTHDAIFKAIEGKSEAFILRKQAEAIEALIDASEIALWDDRTFVKVDCIKGVAQRLYDEADSQ